MLAKAQTCYSIEVHLGVSRGHYSNNCLVLISEEIPEGHFFSGYLILRF